MNLTVLFTVILSRLIEQAPCIMTFNAAGNRDTKINELQEQISDLENQYAEMFLISDNRAQLTNIHQKIEALKLELKQKTPRRW